MKRNKVIHTECHSWKFLKIFPPWLLWLSPNSSSRNLKTGGSSIWSESHNQNSHNHNVTNQKELGFVKAKKVRKSFALLQQSSNPRPNQENLKLNTAKRAEQSRVGELRTIYRALGWCGSEAPHQASGPRQMPSDMIPTAFKEVNINVRYSMLARVHSFKIGDLPQHSEHAQHKRNKSNTTERASTVRKRNTTSDREQEWASRTHQCALYTRLDDWVVEFIQPPPPIHPKGQRRPSSLTSTDWATELFTSL